MPVGRAALYTQHSDHATEEARQQLCADGGAPGDPRGNPRHVDAAESDAECVPGSEQPVLGTVEPAEALTTRNVRCCHWHEMDPPRLFQHERWHPNLVSNISVARCLPKDGCFGDRWASYPSRGQRTYPQS